MTTKVKPMKSPDLNIVTQPKEIPFVRKLMHNLPTLRGPCAQRCPSLSMKVKEVEAANTVLPAALFLGTKRRTA